MKCKVCGTNFKTKKELAAHNQKTPCGQVNIKTPMICGIEYSKKESDIIEIPLKLTVRIQIEKIESLTAKSADTPLVRKDFVVPLESQENDN